MIRSLRDELDHKGTWKDCERSRSSQWSSTNYRTPSENFVPKFKMTTEEKRNKTFKNAKSKRTERFSDMLLQVTTDLAKTKTLDEALETLVKITTSTIGAERGTIFLNDASTGELYSRIAQGNFRREIRILNSKGVAGWVFTKNQGVIIHDAYKDERFNKAVDVRTDFALEYSLSPIAYNRRWRNWRLSDSNKIDGEFEQEDLDLLEAMTNRLP